MQNTLNNAVPNKNSVQPRKQLSRNKKRIIFYTLLMIFPLLHYFVFFIVVNFSMFTMAFETYSWQEGQIGFTRSFAYFDNFKVIFEFFRSGNNFEIFTNSFTFYGVSWLITPLSLFFSYYLYKEGLFSKVFRVVLFLPQILSVVVTAILFKYMVGYVFETDLSYGWVLFYNYWVGFGVQIIMYTSAMCGINSSISESAQLDGASAFREFISITFPMIFSTFATFIITGIAGIFTTQMQLHTLFASDAPFQTMGYFLYIQSLNSNLVVASDFTSVYAQLSWPQLCAISLFLTAIVLPTTLIVRRLLNKYGPGPD